MYSKKKVYDFIISVQKKYMTRIESIERVLNVIYDELICVQNNYAVNNLINSNIIKKPEIQYYEKKGYREY